MRTLRALFIFLCAFMAVTPQEANGAVDAKTQRIINKVNKKGPYLGLVIPNLFEMNPLLQSPSFKPSKLTIDFAGKRFRFGVIEGKQVILVMTGLGMTNAGTTTLLLLSLFNVEGVVHYGIAGNASPYLNIGDVAIPRYWSHSALWNWQRYGDGPQDELALEVNGDYTREVGSLKFADYTTANVSNFGSHSFDNLLNSIWYQPEEVFPTDGIPEERQHVFWIPVDKNYLEIFKKLESLDLEGCLNSTTCLSPKPRVITVRKGTSANIYLDNAAYRSYIYNKFHVSPVDMESAGVSLICYQQRVPFIVFRALSDLAGGGSANSNEAATFTLIAANNSVKVAVEFIKNLPTNNGLNAKWSEIVWKLI